MQPVIFSTSVVTPTVEAIPTETPTPESTEIAPKCFGKVTDGPLRVRATPSLSGAILGAIPKGDTLTLEAAEYDSQNNLWYRIWWTPNIEGYVWANLIAISADADCRSLSGARLGVHLTMIISDAARTQILALSPHLGTLKATTLNGHILAAAKAANPHLVTIYRSTRFPDCPWSFMGTDQWLNLISTDWPPGADYYEFVNECIYSTDRWVDFSIEAMKWANARGCCLLLFSFSVGHPEIAQWQQLTPVFDYALAHPCASGRLHGIALHAYTSGSTLDNDWLFSRFKRLCTAIDPLYCDRLPLYLTEVGDDPQTQGAVDCRQWLEFAHAVAANLAGSQVDGYHLWSVEYGTGWVDASPCLGGL